MVKGQWATCVTSIKNKYAVANAGPGMSTEQVYYIKLENSGGYRFVGIAKDTPNDGYEPGQTACGWLRQVGFWAAGVEKQSHFAPMPRLHNIILQVDMSTSCLACVEVASTHPAQNKKPQGWGMPFSSSPGLADVVQQFFSFQMIVAPNQRSKVLPVTDIDKELFADKSHYIVI